MNASTPCDRLWRKRLSELNAVWPDFVGGRTTGLHKTRVATRRLREALPVVSVSAPASKVKKLNRKMRALTRYLGPIRELDVELALLEQGHHAAAVPEPAVEMLRREIVSKRQALRSKLASKSPVGDVKKLIRKLERVCQNTQDGGKHGDKADKRKNGATHDAESAWRGVLATRLMRRAKALRSALDNAGHLYAPERIHAVRISTKKLRYAVEIAHETGIPGAAALVRLLKRQQERLGHLHDLQVLLKRVREAEGLPTVGARVNELEAYAEALERECRRLHAAFVEHRQELVSAVKAVRHQLVPALTTPPLRQARVSHARPRTDVRKSA
jgi:CHAD domain-containing protein